MQVKKYLEENGTAACGTARGNRKSFKKEPLQKGQCRFLRNENMLAVCFHDKKNYFLSTMHSSCEWKIGQEQKVSKNVAISY